MSTPRYAVGVALLHMRYTFDNQMCENIFGYSYSTTGAPPTTAELTSLGVEWKSAVFPAMRNLYCADVIFRELYMEDAGNPATAGRSIATVSLDDVPGLHSGGSGSGTQSVNLTLRSGLRGRHLRGAKRLGPIPSGEVQKNEYSSAWQALLIPIAAAWLGQRVSARFTPCIPTFTLHSYSRITSVVVLNSTVDSQKTRLTGHGR